MIKNRYTRNLQKDNQLIIDLTPANYALRIELSLEIKKIIKNKPNAKILEFGIGEGNLTEYILKNNPALMLDVLDIAPAMIKSAKYFLKKFTRRINFIREDVYDYLEKIDFKYDLITSAWTVHNFKQEDKERVFKKIYQALSRRGKFLLMDKIYPDDIKSGKRLLDLQIKRFKYLGADTKSQITVHEKQDFKANYRMDEKETLKILKEVGFKDIKIIDRIERDIVLIAEK